jgi:hypothetical protein
LERGSLMRVRVLAEVWWDWKKGEKFTASLGDGSEISAVGRPHRGVCEVHSERGVECRHSSEHVLCQEMKEEAGT